MESRGSEVNFRRCAVAASFNGCLLAAGGRIRFFKSGSPEAVTFEVWTDQVMRRIG
jgi:hypothetical protein